MRDFLNRNRTILAYLIVSVLAIVWNIITIGYTKPWCDEVMLLDTNATMHYYGEWATTAYNDYGEGTRPFNVYMPLYNWLMYIWVSVFGFSMRTIRIFNLTANLILGYVVLKIANQLYKKQFAVVTVVLYALCFWFTDVMMMTYRMSRPEIIGATMAVSFAIYLQKSLTQRRKYVWQMILFAAFSIMAGIQSALYIVLGLLFTAIFVRPIKKMVFPTIWCTAGLFLGFLAAFLHMCYFHEGRGFIICIMNSSAVIMKIWGGIRSIVFPLLGREVTPLTFPVNSDSASFFTKFVEIFTYIGASVLFLLNVLMFACSKAWKNIQEYKAPIATCVFAIFVVFGYNLAGRYTSYYKWTAILPMLVAILLWLGDGTNKMKSMLVGVASIILVVMSVTQYPLFGETPCDRISAFIQKQHFKPSDRIAAPFCTFYDLKPTNRYTYFYQIYPQNLIGDVDYVIIPTSDKEYSYNYDGMAAYLKELKTNPKYKVEKIGEMNKPDLTIYRIKER